MRLVGYVRVSGPRQAEEGTIEIQGYAITEYCERHGHELVAIYSDNGRSGIAEKYLTPAEVDDIENRPALGEMFHALRDNAIDVDAVIVHKFDRWAREGFISEYLHRRLQQMDKGLLTVEDGDASDPTIRIVKKVKDMVSEMEAENIKSRMRGGKRNKARHGGFVGGIIPYGYQTKGRELVIDENMEVVKLIFEMRKTMGYKKIAHELNKRNIPPPSSGKGWERNRKLSGNWGGGTVRYILSNPTYRGVYSYGGVMCENKAIKSVDGVVVYKHKKQAACRRNRADEALIAMGLMEKPEEAKGKP